MVLAALARRDTPAYGMDVYDEIVDTTGRDVSIQAVYVTLNRLEKKGHVVSTPGQRSEGRERRAKRFFKLAPSGRQALYRSRLMFDRLWADQPLKRRASS